MTQTFSQFCWYQRRRVARVTQYMPSRVGERLELLEDDVYEGPADVDQQMGFEYRRGIEAARTQA
jgi:hypothetical protein